MKNYDNLKLRHPKSCTINISNELGGLASGVGHIFKSVTETIFLIHNHQVCTGRKAAYYNSVCDYIPLKDDPYHVQLTIGGDC